MRGVKRRARAREIHRRQSRGWYGAGLHAYIYYLYDGRRSVGLHAYIYIILFTYYARSTLGRSRGILLSRETIVNGRWSGFARNERENDLNVANLCIVSTQA